MGFNFRLIELVTFSVLSAPGWHGGIGATQTPALREYLHRGGVNMCFMHELLINAKSHVSKQYHLTI